MSPSSVAAARLVDAGDGGTLRRRGRRPVRRVGTPFGPCAVGSGRSAAGVLVAVVTVGLVPSCTDDDRVMVVPLASARVQNTVSIVTAIIGSLDPQIRVH